jgi:hypothetical protein
MTIAEDFQRLAGQLQMGQHAYILAELNDLLTNATGPQIQSLSAPQLADPFLSNYVAAMVEQAAYRSGNVQPPSWTSSITPLSQPFFATPWMSLRAHLLLHSPIPFRRRNIFIDATLGDRV